MPRIVEFHPDGIVNIEFPVVGYPDEKFHAGPGLLFGIDGIYGSFSPGNPPLVENLDITFVDMAAVGQHDAAKVAGGHGAHHRSPESPLVEIGYQSRVIDMGMRKNHMVDLRGLKAQIAVHLFRFHPFPLKHPAVQKNLLPVLNGDEVLAPGHFTGGSQKLNLHV